MHIRYNYECANERERPMIGQDIGHQFKYKSRLFEFVDNSTIWTIIILWSASACTTISIHSHGCRKSTNVSECQFGTSTEPATASTGKSNRINWIVWLLISIWLLWLKYNHKVRPYPVFSWRATLAIKSTHTKCICIGIFSNRRRQIYRESMAFSSNGCRNVWTNIDNITQNPFLDLINRLAVPANSRAWKQLYYKSASSKIKRKKLPRKLIKSNQKMHHSLAIYRVACTL